MQAVRRGDWKLHLPRNKEQLPFWDKNKAFANLQAPFLHNLRNDESESTDVADDNPEVVRQMMDLAESTRQDLGEFMSRGKSQRPTGSIFPEQPVISHEKDWGTVAPAIVKEIDAERQKRHPNQDNTRLHRQRSERRL